MQSKQKHMLVFLWEIQKYVYASLQSELRITWPYLANPKLFEHWCVGLFDLQSQQIVKHFHNQLESQVSIYTFLFISYILVLVYKYITNHDLQCKLIIWQTNIHLDGVIVSDKFIILRTTHDSRRLLSFKLSI